MYITPGDPAAVILGLEATPETLAEVRKELGIDQPYIVRLLNYIRDVFLEFDFGISYRTRTPVIDEIVSRLPITIKLTFLSMIIGSILGIAFGIISAVKQYTWIDNITTIIALFGVSTPSFWLAMMMVLIFAVNLGWLPVSGSYGPEYWILPTFTLGFQAAGIVMRMTRSSMLEVIRQDYIRTARAKGQSERIVIMRHALRNALIPIITTIANQTGVLIGGSILVEAVFSMPGLGKYMVESINYLDYPAVQGTILVIAIMTVIIQLAVDIIYSLVDPRIKSIYSTNKKKEVTNGNGKK
jgi:peptide/nickel transport system permease protein